jgi:hypothetical protein
MRSILSFFNAQYAVFLRQQPWITDTRLKSSKAARCLRAVTAAAKVARQLLNLEHLQGVPILVDDQPSNKISRRTALALPLALAASSGAVFPSGFARADEPVRGGTMVMIVQPEPSTLAHYAVTAGNIPPIATQVY